MTTPSESIEPPFKDAEWLRERAAYYGVTVDALRAFVEVVDEFVEEVEDAG
jgi:hypothetical protein